MDIKGCMSHKTDNWKTPSILYNTFMKKGFKDCFKYESTEDETLNQYSGEKLFINPPYSKMKQILKWLCEQIENKNIIYLLIPSRTDTTYYHELLKYHPHIIFIKGRLNFNDSPKKAPFPSIIMIFNKYWFRTYESLTEQQFITRLKKEII